MEKVGILVYTLALLAVPVGPDDPLDPPSPAASHSPCTPTEVLEPVDIVSTCDSSRTTVVRFERTGISILLRVVTVDSANSTSVIDTFPLLQPAEYTATYGSARVGIECTRDLPASRAIRGLFRYMVDSNGNFCRLAEAPGGTISGNGADHGPQPIMAPLDNDEASGLDNPIALPLNGEGAGANGGSTSFFHCALAAPSSGSEWPSFLTFLILSVALWGFRRSRIS